jgi:uncharacterized membrane-anchored protein
MSTHLQRILGIAGLAIALAVANLAVKRHEDTLASGKRIFLELAPVDPRSIMQGDYMQLQFRAGVDAAGGRDKPETGRMVVRLDERGVGSFARIHRGEALAPNEALLEYRVRGRGVRVISDAWFFEEGKGPVYQAARYGEVRARENGVALLVGLRDANLAPLGVPRL